MRQSTERLLRKSLCKVLDNQPKAAWFTIEQLADASPDLQKRADGRYAIIGENASVSLEDLESIECEVVQHAKDAGLFVNFDYDCGLSVHEYVAADEFDFENIETMLLRFGPVFHPFDASEIEYDGATLAITAGWQHDPDRVKGVVIVGGEERAALRSLIAQVDLPHWERRYDDLGMLDGWSWDLIVWFKGKRVFVSEGSNAWPDAFGQLWDGLREIIGLDPEWEYLV